MFSVKPYCNSLTTYSRFLTREVKVGKIGIGGNNPIRIQSMTTTDTMDTLKTVEQSIRMIEAGCELVRITAPSLNEAKNLEAIKTELRKRGYDTPLVADIHFTPNAAEYAARVVEKVRVNPGNYADKKKFEHIDYSDSSYEAELERIRKRFTPLVNICKEYGTAMRIGTNHGSLSDRILSRYGDTPEGMVESALEFLVICEENNYQDIVLSMKASNTHVMVQAYRLLVQRMMETGRNYPLHLGVTEAGEGEDGRIKSAVGIGTLLEDGLGDTVRVSLTEEPEFEMPVAMNLVKRYMGRTHHTAIPSVVKDSGGLLQLPYDPYTYQREETRKILNIGGHEVPRVIADFSSKSEISPASLFTAGYAYSVPLDKWHISDQACDYIFCGQLPVQFSLPGTLSVISDAGTWAKSVKQDRHYPFFPSLNSFKAGPISEILNFVALDISALSQVTSDDIKLLEKNVVLVFETSNTHGMAEQRRMFMELVSKACMAPVIIKRKYRNMDEEDLQLAASTDTGALLLDGFGDGIWLDADSCASMKTLNALSFGILQAARTRISKTEYISCPSCGRTLFDLQETTARIRTRTDHLKGIKIGIMGCIVNGPGEMADADYGYVGTGVGKITLYKGKEVVERNVDSENAVDALIDLIRKNGDWIEKAVV